MNEPHRWHPLAMVFTFLKLLRSGIIPIIGLVVAGRGNFGELFLLPLAAILGYSHYRCAGWGTTDRFRVLRFRGLNRTTVIVPRKNIQTQTMRRSYFQKKGELVTYRLAVMSKIAGVGKGFEMSHLRETEVRELIERR